MSNNLEIVNSLLNPAIPMQDRESIKKLVDVITSGRPYSEILEYIEHEITESTRLISFNYKLKGFLSDTCYAVSRAVEGKVGFTKQSDSGPSNDSPPRMIDVMFADGSHKKVPYGSIQLSTFGEGAHVKLQYDEGSQTLHVRGECQKRYVNDMDNIINESLNYLLTDSIYKGQAIKYKLNEEPEFINLASIDKIDLYLTSEAQFATEPIEARIEKTDSCIQNNIDIKFGVLLEGTYGTGKTLYAFKLARKAIQNGWTFIYCANSEDSLDAMRVAQRYCLNGKGVVLFIEDIDKVLNKRDEYTNEISLMMDGGENKDINLITIFTTNHVERIEPTFLRGKRIGSIVTLTHPDKETAEKMIRAMLIDENGQTLIDGPIDAAAEKVVELEIVPAFIAEIIDKVKTHILFSGKLAVDQQDILNAIMAYQRQMNIAKRKDDGKSKNELFAETFTDIIAQSVTENVMGDKKMEEIREKVDFIYDQQ